MVVPVPIEDTWSIHNVVSSSTGPFAFTFRYFEKADLTVYVDDVALADSAWSVTPGSLIEYGGYSGGSVTLVTAVANAKVTIAREMDAERESNLTGGQLTVTAINTRLNEHTMHLQDLKRDLLRAILAVYGSTGSSFTAADVAALAAIATEIEQVADIDTEVMALAAITTEILAIYADISGDDDIGTVATALTNGTINDLLDGQVAKVNLLTNMQALAPTANDIVFCVGRTAVSDGYEGFFRWVTGDQSANVTADTTMAVWVPLSGQDGSSGAFQRVYSGALRLGWFGAAVVATLQAAIDMLPATGGEIAVDSGDYSAIDPSTLTIAENKMVRWILYGDAAVPSNLPGMAVSQGVRDQPNAGGLGASTRPGAGFYNLVVTHDVRDGQANQQDSVQYIEVVATPEASETSITTELAAVRTNLQIVGGEPVGEGIRGAHHTVVATGGHAKIRGTRVVSIGEDGHDGLVTGGVFTATRTGLIPISAGGNGVDVYASGDAGPYPNEDAAVLGIVGPGIRRNFSAVGQLGKERPQIVFHQAGGNQAVLAEVAVNFWHAGGNGDIVHLYEDENLSTMIAKWRKSGVLAVPAVLSNIDTITIADDAVATLSLPFDWGKVIVACQNSTAQYAEFRYTGGTIFATSLGGAAATTTGVLTGTTGTDAQLNISVDNQTLYIENRLGASRNVNVTVLA